MIATRRLALITAAGSALAVACFTLPASVGSAANLSDAPHLSYDLSVTEQQTQVVAAPQPAEPQTQAPQTAQAPSPAAPAPTAVALNNPVPNADKAALECMAKVVHHEAGNQKRKGMIAVAQTLVNRLKAGRFGDSICAVANQPGQFFDTASYNPPRDSQAWAASVDVAKEVLSGNAEVVAPGAMFFRASYSPANSFFRTRERVATVGAHIFYR